MLAGLRGLEWLIILALFLIIILTLFLLPLIPAKIANKKGYSFGTWYVFGFFFFIVALPASLLINNANSDQASNSAPESSERTNTSNNAQEYFDVDRLKRLKEMLEKDLITQTEYNEQKNRILDA
jgi:CBS domain containing-hemolysin-like protein